MHPISALLCEAYDRLFAAGEVQFPLYETQRAAIDTLVKTVNATYFGIVRFPTPEERAVAYLCYIIKNHPVTDGNKRLAVLWFEVYCEVQELRPRQDVALDLLAISLGRSDARMEELLDSARQILF
jgi:prophage maintenance system killer protein